MGNENRGEKKQQNDGICAVAFNNIVVTTTHTNNKHWDETEQKRARCWSSR